MARICHFLLFGTPICLAGISGAGEPGSWPGSDEIEALLQFYASRQ